MCIVAGDERRSGDVEALSTRKTREGYGALPVNEYDVIPHGTEHVVDVPLPESEPDGVILLPEGSEHVAVPTDVVFVALPKKERRGRKPAFTKKKQKRYLRRISEGDGLDLAARNVQVSPNTVRAHRKKFPEFNAKIDVARNVANQTVVNALFRNATELMNLAAQVYWTTNRMPDEWQDKRGPRVLQQINAAPSVEWSLQEARQEALGLVDELEAKRLAKEAAAIDATSTEVDDG
jgi:hypothetical protein